MDALLADVRLAVRSLRRAPAFALVAIVTLTLGIAANTAVFSLVDAVLLRPLPYPDANRIVMLVNTWTGGASPIESSTQFEALRRQPSFADAAAYRVVGVNLTAGAESAPLLSLQVTADFVRVFGASIEVGRGFQPRDFLEGAPDVIVLTGAVWRRQFGGDPAVVGRTVVLDERPATVVGVAAAAFDAETLPYAVRPDVFTPLRYDATGTTPTHYLVAAARLKSGTTIDAARRDARAAAEEFRRRVPGQMDAGDGFGVEPLYSIVVGDVGRTLWILLGSVACVLLIACVNVANLMLARTTVREREMAIRVAIGASRGRLARQILIECLAVAVPSGMLGAIVGLVGIRATLRALPGALPRLGDHGVRWSINWPVFLFAAIVCVAAAILFGLAPALYASKSHLHGARTLVGRSSGRWRSLLIVTETALAVVLLVGAMLFVRTFVALHAVAPGFDGQRVLVLPMSLRGSRFERTDAVTRVIADGAEQVRALGDVEAVAAGCCPPMLGRYQLPFSIVGRVGDPLVAGEAYISPGYLELFRIPLVRGRTFTARDDRAAPQVVIINSAMARRFWPDGDPLSARLQIGAGLGPEWADPPRQVVGIVGDVRGGGLDQPPIPMMYVPLAQTSDALTLLHDRVPVLWFVRTRSDPFSASTIVHRALAGATGVPVARDVVRSMDQMVADSTGRQRMNMLLMTLFGGAGLVLASVGIYGVTAFLVQQRTAEIGIRLALGAMPSAVRRMMVIQSTRLVVAGVAIGLTSALGLTRLVSALLFGVTPHDAVTFLAVPCALVAIAIVAAWVPARRAARVDPAVALRAE
jgi:predicted permease